MEREDMTKKKILICDDSPEVGRDIKNKLECLDTVEELFEKPNLASKQELELAIKALETRLILARDEKIYDFPTEDAAKIIDDSAVLVIDYALYDLDSPMTGERIAYLARCYSKCGIIIALNQYPPYNEEFFDLTLRGHLESYADLNIPSNSLSNPGLWSEPWSGFRPWSWPLIPQAIDRLERRVTELRGHLDKKSLEFLGFEGVKELTLPRTIVEFLSRDKPKETTFREFVDSEGSGNGLRGRKEQPINDEAIARIAAARIGCWLEYDILPGQDILIDTPHMISRFPSMLGNKDYSIETLDSIASFYEPDILGLLPIIEPFRFMRKDWLSRPAWFWSEIRDNEDIEEVKNPWTIRRLEQAFCEDISRFKPKDNTREFVADMNSPYARRFVKQIEGIQYSPQVRFSL
jgi:hypothetical protein